MTTFDLSPLHRFTVGFDSMGRLLDNISRLDDTATNYPPYNIEKLNEDEYSVVLALAGFSESEIDIMLEDNTLKVSGRKEETKEDKNREYVYKGIANRSFERTFELAGHIKVENAELKDGMLKISLKREIPEHMKPRKIAINENLKIGKKAS